MIKFIAYSLTENDFKNISRTKEYYKCKKAYSAYGCSYKVGKIYEVAEIQQGPCVVLGSLYFYCGDNWTKWDSRPYLFDYFYTDKEERKLKLERINENR